MVLGLKKKIEKYNEGDESRYNSGFFEKEIHIIDPSIAVNQIHDELLLYKQIYENLVTHIRENKSSLVKYESIINVYITF